MEEQVGVRVRLAPVVAEVGNLAAGIIAHATEGRVERARRGITLRSGGREGADSERIAAWNGPQQHARGVCERGHCCVWWASRLRCVDGRDGLREVFGWIRLEL